MKKQTPPTHQQVPHTPIRKWKALQPGDLIDIVAPGFRCTTDELKKSQKKLESWGFRVRIPRKLFQKDEISSAPDEVRFRHLIEALHAPDSSAVWCVRGGYGSIRLLPQLAKADVPLKPKLLLGLSDITSLHLFLNQQWGWASLHAPLLDRLSRKKEDSRWNKELAELIIGERKEICAEALVPLNPAACSYSSNRSSSFAATGITGGNLITLQSSLATPWQWQPQGKIAFVEDIGERGYRVDRVLEHFRQAGLWSHPQPPHALIFADFTGGGEPDGGRSRVPQVLTRFAQSVDFPVFKGLQTGHGEIQQAIPLGTCARLEKSFKKEKLLFKLIVESGCE